MTNDITTAAASASKRYFLKHPACKINKVANTAQMLPRGFELAGEIEIRPNGIVLKEDGEAVLMAFWDEIITENK